MMHSRQTSRALHDEHRANLALLGRLETALGRAPRRPADPGSATHTELTPLIGALRRQIEHDVERHFEFEERELFSRMGEAGERDIAALLAEEHDAIREVAAELLPLTRAFADGSLVPAEYGGTAGTRDITERVRQQLEQDRVGNGVLA